MFTNRRFRFGDFSGEWERDGPKLVRALTEFLGLLESPDSLEIASAQISATNGIKFPATQNAQSDVNTLDDYEELTFTPGVSFGGGTTGITYTTQTASCTKIGNSVRGRGVILLSAKGSSTGAAKITGLPFTVANDLNNLSAVSIFISNISYTGMAQAKVDLNATTIALEHVTEAGTTAVLTDANFTNTSLVNFSFEYRV